MTQLKSKQHTIRHNSKRGLDLSPEQRQNRVKGGNAALAKKVGVCGRSKEQMTADGIKGGSRGGPTTKARGVGIFAPGMQSTAGKISMHRRWHVTRFNPKCELCVKELESRMRLVEIQPELQDK